VTALPPEHPIALAAAGRERTRGPSLAAVAGLATASIWAVWFAVAEWRNGLLALDLRAAYLPAAHALTHGMSPYPPVAVAAISRDDGYLYPPLVGWLVAPLNWLPLSVAEVIGATLSLAAVFAALWLVGVRDWRCYALLVCYRPVLVCMQTANVIVLLIVGSAALRRWRAHARRAGVLLGFLIATKLLLIPLLVWLLAGRRYRAFSWAVASAAAFVLVPWSVTGFTGLATYPRLLRLVGEVQGPKSYTLGALLGQGGRAFAITLGVAALAASWRYARRADERRAFTAAILAVILLSPVVWLTYLALLLVPLALRAPRFNRWWLAPLAFWVCPSTHNGVAWQTATALSITFLLGVYAIGRQPVKAYA
jgi:hypothetical protein